MAKQTDAELDGIVDDWYAKYDNSSDEPEDPHATSIDYVQDRNLLIVNLSNGLRLPLPIENLSGLADATPEQLRRWEIHGLGFGFGFPDLNADFYVPALIEGVYGIKRWMAVLGKKGGSAKSKAKQRAAPGNGAKSENPLKKAKPSKPARLAVTS